MEKYVKPLLSVFLFLFFQCVVSVFLVVVWFALDASIFDRVANDGFVVVQQMLVDPVFVCFSTIASGLVTVIFLYFIRMIDVKAMFRVSGITLKQSLHAILCAVCGVIACNSLQELLELPDLLQDQFLAVSESLLGIVTIGILAPVCEEIVFREGIMRTILKEGGSVPVAIFYSAFFFGIIHINPAQVPFAFFIGLILGTIYARTGNIILTSIIHVINNMISVVVMNVYGEEAIDMKVSDGIGVPLTVVMIVVMGCACFWLLWLFWKKYNASFVPKSEVSALSISQDVVE